MKPPATCVVVLFVASACTNVQSDPGAGPSTERVATLGAAPYVFADLAVADRNYSHDARGDAGAASGRTAGGYARLRGEFLGDSAMGAGLSIEGTRSDTDLLEHRSFGTYGHTRDVYLYSLYYVAGIPPSVDAFRLPFRFGPYYHRLAIESDVVPSRVDWAGIGARLEVEPEYWLLQRDDFSFGLIGGVSGGIHFSDVDIRGGNSRTTVSGEGYTVGASLGLQALFARRVTSRLGFIYRDTIESSSDTEGPVQVKGASATFRGIEFAIGVRF